LDFERGRYFTVADSRSGKNYVLLGFEVAKGLFENTDPVGQTVKISGRNLKVLGVFKKEGEDILNSSIDNAVLIPINYARNIVDTKSDNFDPKIIIKAASNITLNELANEMKGQIRAIRRLSPREDDDFSLNQSSMLSLQLDSLFGVVNIAGWIIGGFSILVGGFGIANIMFVSVKERTNIIGIQKSLGAKNYFILLQFLVEAVVLSIIGGIIGLIIVYIITLVAAAFDFELVLSLANCVLGLGVSAVIGVISGFLPAWNASQLNPVDAIRAK
jgi:putative ABC transport system permease protein